jgi:hypothetical protein
MNKIKKELINQGKNFDIDTVVKINFENKISGQRE